MSNNEQDRTVQQTLREAAHGDASEAEQQRRSTATTHATPPAGKGSGRRAATQGVGGALELLPPTDWRTAARRALRLKREGLV